jgi:hypothetical protein
MSLPTSAHLQVPTSSELPIITPEPIAIVQNEGMFNSKEKAWEYIDDKRSHLKPSKIPSSFEKPESSWTSSMANGLSWCASMIPAFGNSPELQQEIMPNTNPISPADIKPEMPPTDSTSKEQEMEMPKQSLPTAGSSKPDKENLKTKDEAVRIPANVSSPMKGQVIAKVEKKDEVPRALKPFPLKTEAKKPAEQPKRRTAMPVVAKTTQTESITVTEQETISTTVTVEKITGPFWTKQKIVLVGMLLFTLTILFIIKTLATFMDK